MEKKIVKNNIDNGKKLKYWEKIKIVENKEILDIGHIGMY